MLRKRMFRIAQTGTVVAAAVLLAFAPAPALAVSSTGVEGDGWPPAGNWAWKAVARYGGSGYQLGVGSGSNMDTARFTWAQDETYHFVLDYDAAAGEASFAVIGPAATRAVTHTVPGANGRLAITAKTDNETGNYVDVSNVTMGGDAPSPDDGCRAEAVSSSRDLQHLLITHVDLSSGFHMEGDFSFNWGSTPSDEGPAMQIGLEYVYEPPADEAGAWIIYPDGRADHWVGNDRQGTAADPHTSLHAALGYSGQLLYPGPDNDDIGYWESYSPPPPGSIIELRGPGVWDIQGDGAQGGVGREKMKSLVIQQNGITIRGQDYDDGTGNPVQQELVFNNGGTTALFYLEASDLTIDNLHISGTWPGNSGGYALAVGRYTHIGPDPTASGLTVSRNTFNNLRAMFDTSSPADDPDASMPVPLTNGTIVSNTVTDTYYNIFKKHGVSFAGDNRIAGNAFNHVGQGKDYPALDVVGNTGSALIDDNTFDGWRSGQYAIEVAADISGNPIDLGEEDNVFVDQTGGSGAGYERYPLTAGGHALGVVNEDSVTYSGDGGGTAVIVSSFATASTPRMLATSVWLGLALAALTAVARVRARR